MVCGLGVITSAAVRVSQSVPSRAMTLRTRSCSVMIPAAAFWSSRTMSEPMPRSIIKRATSRAEVVGAQVSTGEDMISERRFLKG